MDRLNFRRTAGLVLMVSMMVLFLAGCTRSVEKTSFSKNGFFFDTTISIQAEGKNAESYVNACFALCKELENVFSAEKSESELYQINHRTESVVKVSDHMKNCLAEALRFSELSEGVFDLTIYPVSSLWDFHAAEPEVPDEDIIKEAIKSVDYRKVHLDGSELSFDSPDTMIELGAIAKGYISGVLADYLKESGCQSALINLGGNVRVVGRKPNGDKWKVGIQKPFDPRGTIVTSFDVVDCCVISSGTYERTFTVDGETYHHILDPKTGYPAETDLVQVTVIGENDIECDALATIAVILGREKTLELVERAGLQVSMYGIDQEGDFEAWNG